MTETIVTAACAEPDAPPMFADAWRTGRAGRLDRARALKVCKLCPMRLECGRTALQVVETSGSLYGVWCGVEFTDVTPSRQERDVNRLRAVVARLSEERLSA